MRRASNYYQPKSRRRYKRKNSSPFSMALALIIFSLIIVTGSKIFTNEKPEISQVPISYGGQLSLSVTEKNNGDKSEIVSQSAVPVGTKIDEYKGVAVYSNGTDFMSSHGLNFSEDDYYYGYKWQCVEFVKRFYYQIYGHKMPDGAGNAKYFFNPMLGQGEFNEQRGLIQFANGGDEKPQPDDLLVFTDGAYGHVAIISEVGQGWIEVIQQNSEFPRERFKLKTKNGKFLIEGEREPAGWLRVK